MPEPRHLENLQPCPYLPTVEAPLRASTMKQFGKTERGSAFYLQALKCAQSLWLQGLPAQSLLQINRSFGADVASEDAVFVHAPLPYAAVRWILENHDPETQFIGNPRRHFQHYATRMNAPRRELRSWRAWGCWYLACNLNNPEWIADSRQIAEEGIVEPTRSEILENLRRVGLKGEAELWSEIAD